VYELLFAEVVRKQQKAIPKKDREKIKALIWSLQENPKPLKSKKLVGGQGEYRIRYRDWRILYSVDDRKKRVIIYGILHRKETYR
jgi:mRNA interferase RelE/StbE